MSENDEDEGRAVIFWTAFSWVLAIVMALMFIGAIVAAIAVMIGLV